MKSKINSGNKKKRVPPVAGFDKGPKDFFRSSRGVNFNVPQNNRSFIGMRRGSR